jgi:DNA-binding transcriptional LysR family regulator
MGKKYILILVVVFLSACETPPEPTTTPIVIQNMATVPELGNTVAQWLTEYNAEQVRGALHLEILSQDQIISAINSGDIELAILGGEPQVDWFVTPLMQEAIVVIVNPKISIQSLPLLDLEKIFSGRINSWEDLANNESSVHRVIPLKGNTFRDRFDQVIMKDSDFDPSSLLVSSPDEILDFVRSIEGAIGILPASQLGDGVQVVEVFEIALGESELKNDIDPLWVNIIATSPHEPVGTLREFLVWLQANYLPVQ